MPRFLIPAARSVRDAGFLVLLAVAVASESAAQSHDPRFARIETVAGLGRLNYPQGVAVHRGGTLFVADTNNNRVLRVAPDGAVSVIVRATVARAQAWRGVRCSAEARRDWVRGGVLVHRRRPDDAVAAEPGAASGWAIRRAGKQRVSALDRQSRRLCRAVPAGAGAAAVWHERERVAHLARHLRRERNTAERLCVITTHEALQMVRVVGAPGDRLFVVFRDRDEYQLQVEHRRTQVRQAAPDLNEESDVYWGIYELAD